MMITAMMAIPIIQHFNNDYASVPVESYSYGNEMVKFIGQNTFVGFDGKMFPVSWTVFEQNPNYSPGPQANPFTVSTNNTNTSAPLIEESFSNYSTNHIQSLWQNSAVMIKWNHYVRIAEIFSFTTKGIDASIVIKDLNVTGNYIGTFSMAMGYNSTACTNGFNPSYMNLSSGLGAIPSSDWNVTVGNLSLNWQSEDSIFSSGVISSGSSGDQIILPFNPGTINHNESYTIDPMIYYQPDRITRDPVACPPRPPHITPRPDYFIRFTETGLPSGTSWQATLDGRTLSSTSNSVTFLMFPGTYSYSIGSISGYGVSPSSGSVTVPSGSGIKVVSVTYIKNPTYYNITFTETGLPSGTSWQTTLNGQTQSTTSSSITFRETEGTYSYSIGSVSGYSVSPSSGYVPVIAWPKSVSVTFAKNYGITFTETGLPSGTSWKATMNGQTLTSTSNSVVFNEISGTYSYSIGSVSGYSVSPSSGSVSVGGSQTVSVTFTKIPTYGITFTETGLPSGTSWQTTLNDQTQSTTSSSITFSETSGTYSYRIGSVSGYAVSPSSGSVSIIGGSNEVGIAFSSLGPELGYFHISDLPLTAPSYNFTKAVMGNDTFSNGVEDSYFMMGAEVNTLHFSIQYSNAMAQNQCDGITVSTLPTSLTPSSLTIYSSNGINGKGYVNFTWTPNPGAYGGFLVTFTNPYGSVNTYFNYTFDVYSRFISENSSNSPCTADSFDTNAVYTSSHGELLGYIVATVSGGPGNKYWSQNKDTGFCFGLSFYNATDNSNTNTYNYGIFSYKQYINYSTSQKGVCTSYGAFEPEEQYQQSSSSSSSSTSNIAIVERGIYDTVAAALLLSDTGVGEVGGLVMTLLGPVIFKEATPTSTVNKYWGSINQKKSFCYENWNPGQTNTENLPPEMCGNLEAINPANPTPTPEGSTSVYQIVNDGNGNPSYTQSLEMELTPTRVPNTANHQDFALDYYTYAVSAFIVPIHTIICSSKTTTLKFTQNDFVGATWVNTGLGQGYYTYAGPEYAASTSMPLYLPYWG